MSQIANKNRSGSGGTRRVVRELSNHSLEILPDKDEKKPTAKSTTSAKASPSKSTPSGRPSSRTGQRAPPVPTSASQRRPPTPPTKHVLLAAPRHPEPSDTLTPEELQQLTEMKKLGQKSSTRTDSLPSQSSTEKPASSSSATLDSSSSSSLTTDGASSSEVEGHRNKSKKYLAKGVAEFQEHTGSKQRGAEGENTNTNCAGAGASCIRAGDVRNIEDSDEFDTDLESGEESSSEEEEPEKRRAPNELMMEFLECVMQNEYETAKKLCRMILLYEPDHPEALRFKELIEEKIVLEEQMANASSSEDDEGEEDSSEEEGDSDDDDDTDSSSSEDSEEEKDEAKTETGQEQATDAPAT